MDLQFDISQEEIQVFIAEAEEQLQILGDGLIHIERQTATPDELQALFRAAHTLKGMGGMIGHTRLVDLTHILETGFDGLRKATLQVTTELIDCFLQAVDTISLLKDEIITCKASDVDVYGLIEQIKHFLGEVEIPTTNRQPQAQTASTKPAGIKGNGAGGLKLDGKPTLYISATISPGSLSSAARAFQLMMALQELGELASMTPTLEQIERLEPVKYFRASLVTSQPASNVKQNLSVVSEIDDLVVSSETLPEPVTEPDMSDASAGQQLIKNNGNGNGNGITSNGGEKAGTRSEKTVRTSVERLDMLMNLVGELITSRNRLNKLSTRFESVKESHEANDDLAEAVVQVGRITDQLQEEVMRIRMVPIANVFNRFPRMVRDLAQQSNKDIQLLISGQETELDRSVIEHINDPLIHILRNSVDHGIESPEARLAANKPAKGTIQITARHENGRIIVRIEDDGAGIDVEKLKKSALKKGLITESDCASLTDEKALDLIFVPGLSTAHEVTSISGRGVGMDIVRSNIERVNGSVHVESQRGQGTAVEISLPLTMAIVPTLLVRVWGITFAIPLMIVTETLSRAEDEIATILGKQVIMLRNEVLPLVDLRRLFNLPARESSNRNLYIVVVRAGKDRAGLIVDSLIGDEDVVVKSLGSLIGDVPGISSSAILGDGQVALLIDGMGILKLAKSGDGPSSSIAGNRSRKQEV